MQILNSIVLIFLVAANCFSVAIAADSNHQFVLISEIEWEPLNPARGDKSPQAGTLWGDRNGVEPTGFLVKFADGFSSPPHIHNVAYRGVVIKGHIHNDDPNAENMWMPSGSFWTQPAGEIHITSAKGNNNLAYIEIDKGPYLVLPAKEAFDSGERPINVDESNVVWINQSENSASSGKLKMSYLWGKPNNEQLYGALIQLPPKLTTTISSSGSIFHAVVIKGQPHYYVNKTDVKYLEAGSYFNSKGSSVHKISNKKKEDIILYVRTNGMLEFAH